MFHVGFYLTTSALIGRYSHQSVASFNLLGTIWKTSLHNNSQERC